MALTEKQKKMAKESAGGSDDIQTQEWLASINDVLKREGHDAVVRLLERYSGHAPAYGPKLAPRDFRDY